MTDPWLRSAINDDALVAQLLLRLNQPHYSGSHPSTKGILTTASGGSVFPVEWGIRQPRSKAAVAAASTSASAGTVKKEGERARRSPTTPLSWSGGGVSRSEECEESSIPSDLSPAAVVRSKGVGTNENTNTINKRSRKKKTFAGLKEEESLLLKEQSYLEKELETIRVTLKEQRSLNHSLKRQKIDFQLESRPKSGVVLSDMVAQSSTTGPCLTEVSLLEETPSCSPRHVNHNNHQATHSLTENAGKQEQAVFMLPDLNMMPEDFGSELLVGAS